MGCLLFSGLAIVAHSADAPTPGNLPTPLQNFSSLFALQPGVILSLAANPPRLPDRLRLHLGSNAIYEVVLTHQRSLRPGRFSARGRVAGETNSLVQLSFHDGALAGQVMVPEKPSFQIQPAGPGLVRLRAQASFLPLHCGNHPQASFLKQAVASVESAKLSPAKTGEVTNIIDLLVVYTAAARVGAGGTESIQALIDAAVDETNLAFENSEVNACLRVVYAKEIDYEETGDLEEDLDRLKDDDEEPDDEDDGPIHEVHEYRRRYSADLVCLIVEDSGPLDGIASLMHDPELEFSRKAFSIIRRSYANGYYLLPHEIGHNLGCQHDRENASGSGAYSYSYGHRFTVGATTYHTVMGTQPGLPIPYFSNPNISFMGVPTGIPRGASNSADNARTINRTAPLVARFSTVLTTGAPPTVTITAPTNGSTFPVGISIDLQVQAGDIDGNLEEVEYFVNGEFIGENYAAPYGMTWTVTNAGVCTIIAQAIDFIGLHRDSEPVTLVFTNPPPRFDLGQLTRDTGGQFRLSLRGAPFQTFSLQCSSNLLDWVELVRDAFAEEVWNYEFEDPASTNTSARFYRLVPDP